MNAINTFWISTLALTLVHSLWQALAVSALANAVLRLGRMEKSSIRYAVKVAALFTYFIGTITTFVVLASTTPTDGAVGIAFNLNFYNSASASASAVNTFWSSFVSLLSANQVAIVIAWAVGVLVFSLRFVGGIFYLRFLRIQASPLQHEWNLTMTKLSGKMGLTKVIQLCESIHVNTPVVIGYLKPAILMPIGLLAGLSTQQVEVILVHELAHIRRHDYLINFIQSLGETIFFFNPFVWMLSASIRNERENCCDDVVIEQGYDPKLYVNTLLDVESARQLNMPLALALTGKKNLLLNRIKRIMEQSVKNQNGKERFIPVLLLALGLVLASWLSIESSRKMDDSNVPEEQAYTVSLDTATKPRVERYSRKSVITYDEKGVPHEEITEDFYGEDDLEFLVMPDAPMALEAPEIFDIPGMDELAELDIAMEMPPFPMLADTFPRMTEFWKIEDSERWKEFEKQFSEEFKMKFGDFYAKNGKEMEKMMAEIEKRMSRFDDEWAADASMRLSEKMQKAQVEFQRMAPIAEEQMARMEMKMKDLESNFRLDEESMRRAEAEMRMHEGKMRDLEREMRDFEAALHDEMVKDGYLKSGEEINTINFTEEGIKVNNIKIKEKDQKKYREMQERYMKSKRRYNRVE